MHSQLRRLLVVVAVVALVAQPMVGSVAASSTTPEDPCDRDYIETAWQTLTGTYDYNTGRCEVANDLTGATHADMFASGLALNDMESSHIAVSRNLLTDARTVARARAKATAVREFQNGSNVSEARAAVNQSIEDYYAIQQINLLRTQQANINQMRYIVQTYNNSSLTSEVVARDRTAQDFGDQMSPSDVTFDFRYALNNDYISWNQSNYTLVNGSTLVLDEMIWTSNGGSKTTIPDVDYKFNSTVDNSIEYNYVIGMSVLDPDFATTTNHNTTNAVLAYDGYQYLVLNERIQSETEAMKANATTYVNSLYSTYNNASELDITEVVDPVTLAQEFNTNQETTGSYGWIAAELGLTGLEGDVNSSFTVEYSPSEGYWTGSLNGSGEYVEAANISNRTMSGTLFTDWSPASTNGSFVVGHTYDTANTNKTVLFVNQTANTSYAVEMQGTFTISNLTNPSTGETLNATTLEEQNYQTFNVSSTRQQMLDLAAYRDNVTGTYGTGGSGGSGGWNFDPNLTGGLVAGGGALLLIVGGAFVLTSSKN